VNIGDVAIPTSFINLAKLKASYHKERKGARDRYTYCCLGEPKIIIIINYFTQIYPPGMGRVYHLPLTYFFLQPISLMNCMPKIYTSKKIISYM
jgi:hypothetical protein